MSDTFARHFRQTTIYPLDPHRERERRRELFARTERLLQAALRRAQATHPEH